MCVCQGPGYLKVVPPSRTSVRPSARAKIFFNHVASSGRQLSDQKKIILTSLDMPCQDQLSYLIYDKIFSFLEQGTQRILQQRTKRFCNTCQLDKTINVGAVLPNNDENLIFFQSDTVLIRLPSLVSRQSVSSVGLHHLNFLVHSITIIFI